MDIARSMNQPQTLVMERPEQRYYYDATLALRAAAHYMNTGKLLSPEEAADIDLKWERDVFITAMHSIRFEIDYDKRPAHMR